MGELKVHFLNVGNGDCIIISQPSGRLTVIDINNGTSLGKDTFDEIAGYYSLTMTEAVRGAISASERGQLLFEKGYDIKLTNPVEFIQQNYPYKDIFRYIQTHPHMDHMRGLSALRQSRINITNFWDTTHNFVPELEQQDRADWEEYQRLRGGKDNTVLRLKSGAKGIYYNEEPEGIVGGDGIEILYPFSSSTNSNGDPNNLSYVLRLTYNGISFVFGGDAEEKVWKEIAGEYGVTLKCNVLKASHHGRDSGYCEDAMKFLNPDYVIVSVGKKPDTDASNKYRKHCDNVWSTRWKGNVTVTIPETGQGSINSEYER